VLALRAEQPAWGARKLARLLALEQELQVAPSTVHAILQRHGRIEPAASAASRPWVRFERAEPNALWQIDFKGDFALAQGRCHALTVLDDHSRYSIALKALGGQTRGQVQQALGEAFERYGLPWQINADNGPPWGVGPRPRGDRKALTRLGVWLIRLGVKLTHSRPYHPQTNGKDERFHRTLAAELLSRRQLQDLAHAQREFDLWRPVYNHRRPHEALGLKPPGSRYVPSARRMPAKLPAIEYPSGDWVRQVDASGWLSFKGHGFKLSRALSGMPVAFRANDKSLTAWDVYFCDVRLATMELPRKGV
jgi:transposase InsO family protein